MTNVYYDCINLTGEAACGPNVTTMTNAYKDCHNLTTAACGDNVVDMYFAYRNCYNLTSAACGPNVDRMWCSYHNCISLTMPACSNSVTNMIGTYSGCTNLTTAIFGPNVNIIGSDSNFFSFSVRDLGTYGNCYNVRGNTYLYTNDIKEVRYCFGGRNTMNILNIYVPASSTTLNSCLKTNELSLIGANITWTNDSTNNRYYNTSANIYIYPVSNVEQAKIDNGD